MSDYYTSILTVPDAPLVEEPEANSELLPDGLLEDQGECA